MSTPTERLFELSQQYIKQIIELTTQVTNAVQKLDTIRQDYKLSKWKTGLECLKYVSPLLAIVLLLFGVQYLSCGIDFELGSFKIITHACPKHF
jgi:hypothetical protein